MISSGDALKSLAREAALMPKEEMLEIGRKKSSLYIGIPRETEFQEHRVALVPEAVSLIVANGHRVIVETNAGMDAFFTDRDYSEAGAEIAYSPEKVYEADIILKVTPPSSREIELLKHKQTLFSALQLTVQPENTLRELIKRRVTAIAWDYIQDEYGGYPIVRSMGEIAGNASILIAAELMTNINRGKGMLMGGIAGISPTEVVIIGAGTVGHFAARTALGMGASVKVFDTSVAKLRRLQHELGQRIHTSVLQPKVLAKHLKRADVAIGALRAPHGRTPCVVTEAMVEEMKDGAVIVDISIDQGGCFETSKVTTHEKPVFEKHGVLHYCVPNIASRYSRTASYALSNIFAPMVLEIADGGGCEKLIRTHQGFRHGVYIYNGTLTSSYLGESFNLPYKDLDLLITAF
jgi:alanine dehydrogenase